jgi:hypothetical protein
MLTISGDKKIETGFALLAGPLKEMGYQKYWKGKIISVCRNLIIIFLA